MKIIKKANIAVSISVMSDESHSLVGIRITGIALGDLSTYPKNISKYILIYRYNPLPNPRIIIGGSLL